MSSRLKIKEEIFVLTFLKTWGRIETILKPQTASERDSAIVLPGTVTPHNPEEDRAKAYSNKYHFHV